MRGLLPLLVFELLVRDGKTLKRIGKEMSEEKGCKNRDIVREIP